MLKTANSWDHKGRLNVHGTCGCHGDILPWVPEWNGFPKNGPCFAFQELGGWWNFRRPIHQCPWIKRDMYIYIFKSIYIHLLYTYTQLDAQKSMSILKVDQNSHIQNSERKILRPGLRHWTSARRSTFGLDDSILGGLGLALLENVEGEWRWMIRDQIRPMQITWYSEWSDTF